MSCSATVPLLPRETAELRAFHALWLATRELFRLDDGNFLRRPGWTFLFAETGTTLTAILERRGDELGIWIDPP